MGQKVRHDKTKRRARWYFAGLASAGAVCFSHPMDMLKVVMQTQPGYLTVRQMTAMVVRKHGFLALYNGLTASILRQLIYATVRFGIYGAGRQHINTDLFVNNVLLSGVAGACGGFLGTPAELVNVRLQGDVMLPKDQQRHYKHVFHGLHEIYRKDGFLKLFSGVTTATGRGALITIGEIAVYTRIKSMLLEAHHKDNLTTHFSAALVAGTMATTLTHPVDVIKTRYMSAIAGQYSGIWNVLRYTAFLGPMDFFKGYVPAFGRMVPQTILNFVFMEQLRQNFGIMPER